MSESRDSAGSWGCAGHSHVPWDGPSRSWEGAGYPRAGWSCPLCYRPRGSPNPSGHLLGSGQGVAGPRGCPGSAPFPSAQGLALARTPLLSQGRNTSAQLMKLSFPTQFVIQNLPYAKAKQKEAEPAASSPGANGARNALVKMRDGPRTSLLCFPSHRRQSQGIIAC